MCIFDTITVIIPSYKPDEKLLATLNSVIAQGFSDIIVVDDGGGDVYAPIFEQVKKLPGCTVLHHPKNKGKGAALKTAFAYYLENRPFSLGVVTADADGQHLASDMEKVARAMEKDHAVVLGCRDFSEPHVPPRSKAGNRISRFLFRSLLGIRIFDTQTGLRAIPKQYLAAIASAEGDRYEYETHMLFLIAREKIPMTEQTIETVYLDNNASSHFRALHDSARIYARPLRFLGCSLGSAIIDTAVYFCLFAALCTYLPTVLLPVACLAGARVFSATINYLVNGKFVFPSAGIQLRSYGRYTALACLFFLVTAVLFLASIPFAATSTFMWLPVLLKSLVGILLFFPSFRIQHNTVFRP